MARLTRAQIAEREQARDYLRETLSPGDTVRTILRHRSQSGMLRVIDLLKFEPARDGRRDCVALHIGYNAALAMGERYDRDREGIRVSGCGMDMGFAVVYSLARTLWPEGFACIGDECPSNDHSNGDRDYNPGHTVHTDGGYALHQRWL